MKKVTQPGVLEKALASFRRKGKTIGFVPTMGALHEGHLSLVRASKKKNDVTVVSIFVNPLQFGPKEDLKNYPRLAANDLALLKKEKVDFVFMPSEQVMYEKDHSLLIGFESVTSREASPSSIQAISNRFCGEFRPGHFRGVMTVVAKLFNVVKPCEAYFGAKDFQQAVIIRKMARELNQGVSVRILPTIRENAGLALSSRNQYLTPGERRRALKISEVLFWLRDQIWAGGKNLPTLLRQAEEKLLESVDSVQYLAAADPETLIPLEEIQRNMVILTACFVGKTRLIDNVILHA